MQYSRTGSWRGSAEALRRRPGRGRRGGMKRLRQAVRVRRDQGFKGRRFTAEVLLLWAVRWYLKFLISYRALELAAGPGRRGPSAELEKRIRLNCA